MPQDSPPRDQSTGDDDGALVRSKKADAVMPLPSSKATWRVRRLGGYGLLGVSIASSVFTTGLLSHAVFVATLAVLYVAYLKPCFRSFNALQDPTLSLEKYGNYDEAMEAISRSLENTESDRERYYYIEKWGYVALRSGDLLLALKLFCKIEGLESTSGVNSLPHHFAITHALQGDTNKALAYLSAKPQFTGATHAVVWAKCEEWNKVRELTPPTSLKLTKQLYPHELRLVALMKAFATSPTDPVKSEQHLALARQAYLGEYNYLVGLWPELREFLEMKEAELRPENLQLAEARLVKEKQS